MSLWLRTGTECALEDGVPSGAGAGGSLFSCEPPLPPADLVAMAPGGSGWRALPSGSRQTAWYRLCWRLFRLSAAVLLAVIVWLLFSRWLAIYWRARPRAVWRSVDKPVQRLKVAVYYEALCPDSKHFIVQQLHNHYDTVEQFLDIQLIPYGKAKTIGSGVDSTFECQHGPSECWGNKIHACGIQQANSQRVAVEFASCLMRHYFRLTANSAQTCAENSGLSWSDISTCVKSTDVNVLMERYGELTHALRPAVTFIPTITVDESQSDQRKLRNRFVQTICSIYQAKFGHAAESCTG